MKWSRKAVLVTGAAGFIGKNLVKKLLDLNAHVIALDNLSLSPSFSYQSECEFIRADVCDYRKLEGINEDIDIVFHLAAPSSVILFNRNPIGCFNTTIEGFLNILRFCMEREVKKLIYASSGSVYGNTPLPQSEDQEPKPVNLYGVAKLALEKIASVYSDQVESVGLRIFAGYGPGEEHKGEIASPVAIFLFAALKGEPLVIYGNGEQSRDFIYIDDVVGGLIKAAERKTPPIINIGSGRSYKFNYVINLIKELLGIKARKIYVPEPPRYLKRTKADITLMRKHLEIDPIPLIKGLELFVEYVRNEKIENRIK